jgi:hypothetical protein
MSLHYYLNLCDGNINRALAVKGVAMDQFAQFEQYLRNSISSLKRKAKIEAAWEPAETENLAELSIMGGLYEFRSQTVIRINNNAKGRYRIELLAGTPSFNKKIEYQIGDQEGEAVIIEDDYSKGIVHLEGVEATRFDNLRWGFANISLEPAWIVLQRGDVLCDENDGEYKVVALNADEITVNGQPEQNGSLFYGETEISFTLVKKAALPPGNVQVIQEDQNTIVFYSPKKIDENEQVNFIKRINSFIDYNNIYFESDPKNKLDFEIKPDAVKPTVILHNASDYDKIVVSNNIRFKVNRLQQNNMEKYKIQLKEIDEDAGLEDEQNALSTLVIFLMKT